MNLIFAEQDWEDYLYWQKQDRKVLNRINQFIPDCMRAPYVGIGKPEPLKHAFAGYWSRRITGEHRLVYKVTDEALLIA